MKIAAKVVGAFLAALGLFALFSAIMDQVVPFNKDPAITIAKYFVALLLFMAAAALIKWNPRKNVAVRRR
jgi:membrane protein DedA with SNARE-associated domain